MCRRPESDPGEARAWRQAFTPLVLDELRRDEPVELDALGREGFADESRKLARELSCTMRTERRLDIAQHRLRRGVPRIAIGRRCACHDRAYLGREGRERALDSGELTARELRSDDGFGEAAPEPRSGQQLVENHAACEDVGATVYVVTERLFGRHVRDLALERADACLDRAVVHLRDPEVHELHEARVRDEDVLR